MAVPSSHRLPAAKRLERKLRWWSAIALSLVILLSFYWFGNRTKSLLHEQNRLVAAEMVGAALAEAHSRSDGSSDASEDADSYRQLVAQGRRFGSDFEWKAILPTGNEEQSGPAGKTESRLLAEYSAARLPEGIEHEVATLPEGIRPFDRIIETDTGIEYQYYRPLYATRGCVECHRNSVASPQPDLEEGELLAIMRISFDHGPTTERLAEDSAMLWMTAIVTGFLSLLVLWFGIRLVLARTVTKQDTQHSPPASSSN